MTRPAPQRYVRSAGRNLKRRLRQSHIVRGLIVTHCRITVIDVS
jgi:hypothetical protein